MAELDGATDGNQIKESEVKQTGNVRVGLIFDTHAIDKPEEVEPKKVELKTQLKSIFSPDAKNIMVLECSFSIPEWEEAFLEGFGRYSSMRKAAIFAEYIRRGRVEDEGSTFDSEIEDEMQALDKGVSQHPEADPDGSYQWVKYKSIDELIDEGYEIKPVLEEGLDPSLRDQTKEAKDFQTFKSATIQRANNTLNRNSRIASQLNSLATHANGLEGKTNIAGIFGSTHKSLVELFPTELRDITTVYIANAPQHPLNFYEVVFNKLMKGKEVTDKDWERMRRDKKPSVLDKARHNIRSRMN